MKIVVVSLFLLALVSCKSVGVIESNDPKIKIRDGYSLLQAGRSLPALRLFVEANEILKSHPDESLRAQSFVALGDVYKFKDGKAQTEKTYNFNKSVTSYEEAAVILSKLKYNQRLSMVYWGIAQAYREENNAVKTCEYLNKAAKAYYEPSGGADDGVDKNSVASLIPYFEHSKKQNFRAACGASEKK